MSEQTPNTPENLNGEEPSMEDILASIRKIISDDEPVAMESPEDAPTVDLVETSALAGLDDMMQGMHLGSNDLTSDAVLDAAVIQPASVAPETLEDDLDNVDLNIDDVLAGLDEDLVEPESKSVTPEDDALASLLDDIDMAEPEGSLEITPEPEDDILSFLDADIPLSDEAPDENIRATAEETAVPEGVTHDKIVANDDVEMDSLLDEILMSPLEDDVATASDEDLIATDFSVDTTSAEASDLELVKSLMADLADDPSGLEADEDLDALLAIPEAEDENELNGVLAEVETAETEETDDFDVAASLEQTEAEDDILSDILDMTLDDEIDNHPDDVELDQLTSLDAVLDAEQENLAESIEFAEDIPVNDASEIELPSLSEIAASAEADAVAVETAQAPQAVAATAGLAAAVGGAALGATTLGASPAEAETETAETYSEPEPESAPESANEPISTIEETSMPVKAVKTDAILDEVTETAAAGAFAELNQVVEDKAVFTESGPRIGDLVQDALRPMLKEWLDANLKGIVERAVTKEVKRISSGK